jgi:hypothetical protein
MGIRTYGCWVASAQSLIVAPLSALVVLASSLLASCNDCADEGCLNYIGIHVIGEAQRVAAAEVSYDGKPSERCTLVERAQSLSIRECGGTRLNDGTVLFTVTSGTPKRLSVRLYDAQGVLLLERDVSPTFREHAPNGRACGPICTIGTAEL